MILLSNVSIFIIVVLMIAFLNIILSAEIIETVEPCYKHTKYGVWISRSIAVSIYLLLKSVLP